MAFHFTAQYPTDVEERMRGVFQSLSEEDRRRYAAVEAGTLGRTGGRVADAARPHPRRRPCIARHRDGIGRHQSALNCRTHEPSRFGSFRRESDTAPHWEQVRL